MSSNFICIRDAPSTWNSGVVQGMFSQYGPIDDITIEPNPNSATNFIIIEFECIEDAEAAVEDNQSSEQRVTFYRQIDETRTAVASVVEIITPTQKAGPPPVEAIHCANLTCTNQVVVEGSSTSDNFLGNNKQGIYCSRPCYCEYLDMKGRVNIYDKWIASLGRSGTGMLKDPTKLDKIVITLDPDGVRRISLN